ncbi:cell wall metabolism sensor histidine kinase WalK [Loigolactobacillus bifermentans]|jgi:two-component system sensor histidine kinase VicK|uniref:histidine kinase n=1 Tax=Loigolactobacillus bifermentans DSM 20003 TaxID=1423726 RepID=A0A0R1GGM3_9LACO|nr:cell wall metabolism sensor histidine kinase WalK [Loigolactobacillus bifermentans]KRK33366.1 histidine protein kinase [Loigolactobacillus bifermentans DSM 20003]QGG60789.1 cell wall metabolism sensor histidine kinase WalK [Loigolactobacillus bifermentans]
MNKKIRFFQSINFKIAIVFILLLMITLEIIGAYFVKQLEQQNIESFKQQVQTPAYVNNQLATELQKSDASGANKEIANILSDLNNSAEIRVVDSKGIVRGTSDVNDQGEIGQKIGDNQTKNVLYNNRSYETLSYDDKNHTSYYVNIVPLVNASSSDNSSVVGAIYVRANMESVYKGINNITLIFLTASLVAALFSSMIAIVISRAITRPIEEMKKQAIRMSRGDYSGQVHVYGQDELGQLAMAVNNLSVRVEEAQETSEAERRRLDSVLSHMTDGVISTDRRGNVIIINEAAAEFLDVDADAVIGQSILELLKIEADYTIRDLLENQEEIMLDFSQHGHDLIVHVEFSLIQRETGFISGIVCVLHDVTEQQKNERERRQFVSNVSHELRTPLTSMRSYLEALTDGAWQDPEVAPDFLHVTQEETERMIRMINDLLSLSRMDSGTAKMELEMVNINELMNYDLNRFDMMIQSDQETTMSDTNRTETIPAAQKKYSIKREFTSRDLWVEIDTDRFMQVIDNIMNNAIKYSPDGGVITVALTETNNQVILSISDQGLGIPKKDLPHVFDRFYRVDKARSRAQGGTGLGLAISKEVITALNGRIWVESKEGQGSTFSISLPYQPYDEDEGDDWDEV